MPRQDAGNRGKPRRHGPGISPAGRSGDVQRRGAADDASKFHNPYTFVPTPVRDRKVLLDAFAGDHDPSDERYAEDHSRLWPGRYTGAIPLKLTVVTPVFVTDPSYEDEQTINGKAHRTYRCAHPLPPTSVKGMLRSAYETLTNSRYGVFSEAEHSKPMEFRNPRTRSRESYRSSAWSSLHESLKPPTDLSDLSPAERLFGWVSPKGGGAWKGKIRISGIDSSCEPLRFQSPVPLAILGAPKPAQARFYLGDNGGQPQPDGREKDKCGYDGTRKIRGRKVYWKPRGVAAAEAYWEKPHENRIDQPKNGYYQEYRGPDNDRSDQNRSISSWIVPNTEMYFTLYVQNLTLEELGALLCMATIASAEFGRGATFRLGLAKPLGLGCVKLELSSGTATDAIKVYTTEMWKSYWRGEPLPDGLSPNERETAIGEYRNAMERAYGNGSVVWKDLPFVSAFLATMCGPRDQFAVHYPRISRQRVQRDGRLVPSYKWFVENDGRRGMRLSLPGAENDQGLPYVPVRENR